MANPKNFAAVDDVSATTGMPVIAMVAMPSQVRDCINRFLRANAELTELSHEIAATAKKEVDLEQDDSEDASPVARFVSLLINQPSTTTAPISISNRRKTVCSYATASMACCISSKKRHAP